VPTILPILVAIARSSTNTRNKRHRLDSESRNIGKGLCACFNRHYDGNSHGPGFSPGLVGVWFSIGIFDFSSWIRFHRNFPTLQEQRLQIESLIHESPNQSSFTVNDC
jgi:hypothetical protein